MPIYRFKCNSCGEEFEDFRNIGQTEEKGQCLGCQSNEIERVEKIVAECDCGCGCSDVEPHLH